MKILVRSGVIAAAVFIAIPASARAPIETAEGDGSPVIVELFTSQGCPLCPQANVLLAELDADEDVLGLSLSVNIMDALGWRDTLAQEPLTARQEAYSQSLDVRFPYTPQIVVGGADDVRGSRPRAVRKMITRHKDRRAPEGQAAPTLSVSWSDNRFQVSMTPAAVGDAASSDDDAATVPVSAPADQGEALDVWLLAYQPGAHVVDVAAGDNAGERVRIHNAVMGVERLGVWSGAEAAFETTAPTTAAAVVLVQSLNHGPIVAARTAFAPNGPS